MNTEHKSYNTINEAQPLYANLNLGPVAHLCSILQICAPYGDNPHVFHCWHRVPYRPPGTRNVEAPALKLLRRLGCGTVEGKSDVEGEVRRKGARTSVLILGAMSRA